MKPYFLEIPYNDPAHLFLAVKHIPYSLFLDSADQKHPKARYSYIMCQPIETIECTDGKIIVTNWDQKLSFSGNPFLLLRARMQSWINRAEVWPDMPPFQGGAAGLFGYDLARSIEKLPAQAVCDMPVPDMAIGIYDQVIAYDHEKKKCWIFTYASQEDEAQKKRDYLLGLINQKYIIPKFLPLKLEWTSNFDAIDYMDNVEKVIAYIKNGDIFQANIAQRFEAELPENYDAYLHYLNLRKISPAPYAAFYNLGTIKVASASPEQFLKVQDNIVETSPIKGTRPHIYDAAMDNIYKNELLNSEKDRAENTMIVDLLRNDLARVCEPSSVEVLSHCRLETFSHVHHLVSTITGRLHSTKGAIDLLRACFPGGSITGAPKIRAMEIIEEIEGIRRGVYCGSIGYIGFEGAMDTNILIRTLVYHRNKVSLSAGGGITVDSDPNKEYQETFDKAGAILHSFTHCGDTVYGDYAKAV